MVTVGSKLTGSGARDASEQGRQGLEEIPSCGRRRSIGSCVGAVAPAPLRHQPGPSVSKDPAAAVFARSTGIDVRFQIQSNYV